MTSLIRIAPFLICWLTLAGGLVRGETTPAAEPRGVDADLALLMAGQPAWSWWASAEAAFGYKDNLAFSSTNEEGSALERGNVQFLVMRARPGPLDLSLYTLAARTHFFSGRIVDHEAQVWTQAEAAYRLSDSWKFSFDVRGYYDDGVFDVSESQVDQRVAELRLEGITFGPTVRWTMSSAWWIEAEGVLQRERVRDGDDDRKVGEGWLRIGWKHGDRIEISLGAMERWHNYDLLPLYYATGREVADSHRKIAERQAELRGDVTWGTGAHWKTSTRLRVGDYTDNGPGYFNTHEKRVSQRLTWTTGPWLTQLQGAARRVDYEVQTVGFGIETPRVKDEFSAKLEVERKLGQRWTLFGNYSWERVRSNDPVASYVVNEGLLGVRWSWDK